MVPVIFTFYIQGVLKLKKIIPAPKRYAVQKTNTLLFCGRSIHTTADPQDNLQRGIFKLKKNKQLKILEWNLIKRKI